MVEQVNAGDICENHPAGTNVENHFNYNPKRVILSAPVMNMLYFYSYPFYPKVAVGTLNSFRILFKSTLSLDEKSSSSLAKYYMRHDEFVEYGKNKYVIVEGLNVGGVSFSVSESTAEERKDLFSFFDTENIGGGSQIYSKDLAIILGDELRLNSDHWDSLTAFGEAKMSEVISEIIEFLASGNGSRLGVVSWEINKDHSGSKISAVFAIPGVINYNAKITLKA